MRCLAVLFMLLGTCIAATGVMAEPDHKPDSQVLPGSMVASGKVRVEIERLLLLQDSAARGDARAASRQNSLLLEIGEIISTLTEAEYPELAVDATIYVLSGGDPGVAERITRFEGLSSRDRGLLRACIFFMRGDRDEATKLLTTVDPLGLSARLAGRVALAQALAVKDPAKQDFFSIAASAMPGTLVEESALRRSALHFANARDESGFWRRLDRYARRFPSSSYAPAFWGDSMTVLADWSRKEPRPSLDRLDTILTMLPQDDRRRIYLVLARRSAAAGEPNLTGLAGRRLRRLAAAGSIEDQLGLFYTNLYQIVSVNGDSAFLKLKTIQPETLGPQERALLKAALALGKQIESPPSLPSVGMDVLTEKTATELRGGQLLKVLRTHFGTELMSPPLVQGLNLSRLTGHQAHAKGASDDSKTKMFGEMLEGLVTDQPEASNGVTDGLEQYTDTAEERATPLERGDESQQALSSDLLLTLPRSTLEPEQDANSAILFATYRAVRSVRTQDWRPVDVAPHFLPKVPEIEEGTATLGIEKACQDSLLPNAGADVYARTRLMDNSVSWVESPGIDYEATRTVDDDVIVDFTHSSPDPEPFPSMASVLVNRSMDQAVAPLSLEPAPARQILSLIEEPLKLICTSTTSTINMRTQAEEVRVLRMMLTPVTLGEVEVTLRRRGTDMQIRIVVSKQTAADVIQADLGLLKERIVSLLPADGTQSISIAMQSLENNTATGSQQHHRVDDDSASAWHGGASTGGGEKPSSRKEDARSPVEGEIHDQDTASQLHADGIVV